MNKYLLIAFIIFLTAGRFSYANAQVIITVAGTGTEGYFGNDSSALECLIHWPEAVALDDSNNFYIADADNNVIRKVYGVNGKIGTVVGTGFEFGTGMGGFGGDGGPATAAQLSYPSGVAIDNAGNMYIADQNNNRIRKVDPTGMISTFAGTGAYGFGGDNGPAASANLAHPTRVALDGSGNVYIADSGNNRIRMVNTSGNINTIAGVGTQGSMGDGGLATAAQLYDPMDMAVDASGNVYIADYENNKIRKVTAATGNISTYAGIGPAGFFGDSAAATNANLYEPSGIIVDAVGNIYFSDLGNERVRKIDTSGMITTITGNGTEAYGGDGGLATKAKVWFPEGLAMDRRGQLYIADKGNNRIRLLTYVLAVNNVQNTLNSMTVYPNPSNGEFTLRISSAVDENVVVMVTNVTGEKIADISTTTNKATNISLTAPPGVYFLSASTAHGVLNEKLLIQ